MPQLRRKPKESPTVAVTETSMETDPKFSTINIDVRSCFVCRKDTSIFSENLFKINTKHSDTPVLKYIDKFLGYTLVKDESFERLIICKCCMTKIDEFDKVGFCFSISFQIDTHFKLAFRRTKRQKSCKTN